MKKFRFNSDEIRRINNQDRIWFVRKWADYVRTHPDKVWSRQQNILINSAIQNARSTKLTREQYLKIKGEFYND